MITDCVRSHVAWMMANAQRCGGHVGRFESVEWATVPAERTMHLLFPVAPTPEDVAAAVARADALGMRSVALWSAVDEQRPWLAGLGFEIGWQPWWMDAPVLPAPPTSERVRLATVVHEWDAARGPLLGHPDVLLAEACVDGRPVGRAWLHVDGAVAGLYDMEVWPQFSRRGLGRDLLGLLMREAASRGAELVTLNATPDGALLYRGCGFRMLGAGRTWWRHRHH